jgi:glycosyltransferase involved in cell wall biosynthesis
MTNNYIFFSGELPPDSLNGIAYSNACLIKHLENSFNVIINREFVDLKDHKKVSITKIFNFLDRLINIIKISYKKKFKFFYIVFSNSLPGVIKTLLIIYSFKLFNKKTTVIVHLHRGDLEKKIDDSYFFKLLFKLVMFNCNKLIVLSDKIKEFILSRFQFNNEIYCLDNTVFNEVKIKKKEINSNILNCIYISNYIEEKGVLILLEAFKILGNNFKLNCFGSFTDEALKEIILKFESQNITINGPIYDNDKYIKISNSDLLILPSFNEGKPIVLLESMMLGTPFISSKVGYINELVETEYPYLLDKVEVEYLVQLIKNYSLLPILERNLLSNNLINRYDSKFSNNIYFENINKIFNG